jgi:hypothetical protein
MTGVPGFAFKKDMERSNPALATLHHLM